MPAVQVVTILQDMQKEIEAEGDKEKDLCARARTVVTNMCWGVVCVLG